MPRLILSLVSLGVIASVGATAALIACGGGQARAIAARGSSTDAGDGDASDAAPAWHPESFGPSATCPEDAPWSGTVCQGHGYVACPGGMYLDSKSSCVRDAGGAPSSSAKEPKLRDKPEGDDDGDDSSSGSGGTGPSRPAGSGGSSSSAPHFVGGTGVRECDDYFRKMDACAAHMAPSDRDSARATMTSQRDAIKRALRSSPGSKSSLANWCRQMNDGLRQNKNCHP